MASFAPSPSSPSTSEESPPSQQQPLELEQQQQPPLPPPPAAAKEKECVHRTKTIQFLGRTTPIVLQNDNGPCPLLAICNVLLLRNNLNLSPDISEVSQEKLLSLVAERLIDSNSNVNNKDAGYVENQQQNIADAIDLLPHLATGIDVNLRFRRIDDFEFTRECAIFDLVDIPLYHGWIVDPQDYETANAIGSKSYNALMGELVALETQNLESESKNNTEEDCIDFAAATTATLGVPSPSLSKACSFDESPQSVSDQQLARKGDLEEEAELLRVLRLSESALPTSVSGTDVVDNHEVAVSTGLDESAFLEGTIPLDHLPTSEGKADVDHGCSSLGNNDDNNNSPTSLELLPGEMSSFPTTGLIDHVDLSPPTVSGAHMCCTDAVEKISDQTFIQINDAPSLSCGKGTVPVNGNPMDISEGEKVVVQSMAISDILEPADISKGHESSEMSDVSSPILDSDPSSGRMQKTDALDAIASSVDGSEPMYEGEECILDSGATTYESREPVYEGEVILAEQADKTVRCKEDITPQQGELIRNFLRNNASQLTFYGLFCLQDGLKERELCVFFRNNHFSTMFKYDGELYLLATDQGYINQPDLVWEKLNEVNGDTLFMTGNFKEFKVESHANDPWDENNAMTSTADYLASIDSATQAGLDINADLQLAIALQQQEFEQQQPPRHQAQQPPLSIGSSRLITGPQVPSRSSAKTSSSSSSRPEPKSKDKCTVM